MERIHTRSIKIIPIDFLASMADNQFATMIVFFGLFGLDIDSTTRAWITGTNIGKILRDPVNHHINQPVSPPISFEVTKNTMLTSFSTWICPCFFWPSPHSAF